MIVIKIGMMRIRDIMAIVDPRRVSFTARWPSPLMRSSCPGRTPSPVSSSGAPRKIDGIKSRKVWVIAIAVIKIRRMVIGRLVMTERESIERATRLIWMPGIKPVMVPANTPINRAAINVII